MRLRLWAAVGIVLLAAFPATGGQTDYDYGVNLMAGYDSNPLEVSRDGTAPGASLAQLRLDGSVSRKFGPNFTLFADADARGRWHASDASGADFDAESLRAGLAFSPPAVSRLLVGLGGRYASYRATYTDRADGEVYEVGAVGEPAGTTIPIADRLNHEAAEAFLNLRWRQNKAFRLFFDARYQDTDYREDYGETTNLEPLDFRAVTLEPGLSVQVHRAARLVLSVARTDLDYDRQSALDEDGFRVPGQTRSYEYLHYRLTLRVEPVRRWSLSFGARASDRSDTWAGYYDYGSMSSYVAVDHELSRKNKLRFYTSYSDLSYDNATVTGDPAEQTLDEKQQTFLARFEHATSRRMSWFVEGGARNTDSRDPDFIYEGDWVLGGVELRR